MKVPDYLCWQGRLTCDLTSPDGGEVWQCPSEQMVEWRICFDADSDERISRHQLSVSTDNGTTWGSIADSVGGGARTYQWVVSDIDSSSDQCLVRVISYVDTLRKSDSLWIPAYGCTCTSEGNFTIACYESSIRGLASVPALDLQIATSLPTRGTSLIGHIHLNHKADVRLAVYDVRGQLVGDIVRARMDVGKHPFRWDLRNRCGKEVAPGVYFVRLSASGRSIVRKIVIQR